MENESFKIGDNIFVKTRWNTSIEEIKRETKTRFYTNNTSFYKENNCIVGCAYTKVIKATQEHFDMFAKNKLARQINDFDFNLLSFNALKEINTLISMNKA